MMAALHAMTLPLRVRFAVDSAASVCVAYRSLTNGDQYFISELAARVQSQLQFCISSVSHLRDISASKVGGNLAVFFEIPQSIIFL